MQIKKVKLVNGGMKGVVVDYLKTETKDGKEFPNEHQDKRKHPIHAELEDQFLELRHFVLEICGYFEGELGKKIKDRMLTNMETTGIVVGEDWFQLIGKYTVMDTKVVSLVTPVIHEDDDYEFFDTVMKIIDAAISETLKYMAGEVKVTDQEVLMRYASKKDIGYSFEQIKDMTPEEQKDLATKILEKIGSIVIHNEDVAVDAEEVGEVLEQFQEKKGEIIPLMAPQLKLD